MSDVIFSVIFTCIIALIVAKTTQSITNFENRKYICESIDAKPETIAKKNVCFDHTTQRVVEYQIVRKP